MSQRVSVSLAPGDGIGSEIMGATLSLFRAAGIYEHVEFRTVAMGQGVFARGDSRGLNDEAIRTIEESGLLFKGPMATPKGGGGKSINVTLRKLFNTFANLRHFRTLPGVQTVYSKAGVAVDFSIVRENVEDTYGGIEQRMTADVFQCKRLASAPGCDQVHRFAFDTARRLALKGVVCGHKANIMKLTDGLFLDRFRACAKEFPEVAATDMIVDALCMNLVMRPHTFDMIVLPNLQGDIVSDLAAGLVGGLGFAPSANIGRHISIFEAVHGTAPDIAGKGIANPTSLILSGLMMLRHIGLLKQAGIIENALLAALETGVHTGDFGDPALPGYSKPVGTEEFTKAIISKLGEKPKTVVAMPVPEQSTPTVQRAARPADQLMLRTFAGMSSDVVGADLYIDAAMPVTDLAESMNRLADGTPFKLTLISNRGTQVWPTGSIYTECVDYYCVRFELREDVKPSTVVQQDAVKLMVRCSEAFTVSTYELLRSFDGVRGYSLAQGQ